MKWIYLVMIIGLLICSVGVTAVLQEDKPIHGLTERYGLMGNDGRPCTMVYEEGLLIETNCPLSI